MFGLLFNCIDTEFFKLQVDKFKKKHIIFEISSIYFGYGQDVYHEDFSTFLHVSDEKIFKKNKDVIALTGINCQYLSCAPSFDDIYNSVFFRKPTDYFVFWGKKDIFLLNAYLSKIPNCSFFLNERNCIDLQEEYGVILSTDETMSLSAACREINVTQNTFHNSCDDAIATKNILCFLVNKINSESICNYRSSLCSHLNNLDIFQKSMLNNCYKQVSFNGKLI